MSRWNSHFNLLSRNAATRNTQVAAILAVTGLLLGTVPTADADVVVAINKSFGNASNDPLTFLATGTFDFPAGFADIEGTVGFSKLITLSPNLDEFSVQHILIGEWDESWSLTKIGFRIAPAGGLTGFDPSEVTFGDTGTFDVDIEMTGPVPPGHEGRTDFTAEQPITMMTIDELIPFLETLALGVPEVEGVIDAIVPGADGLVPVATTSLHIPEPSSMALLMMGTLPAVLRRKRRSNPV